MTKPVFVEGRCLCCNKNIKQSDMNSTEVYHPTNTTINGTTNNFEQKTPGYIIAVAVIIPIFVTAMLVLALRYCVTRRQQTRVTLTMRRTRRIRRLDALHINVEFSDSNEETKESRSGYTNLGTELSPDDNKLLHSTIVGQTDSPKALSLRDSDLYDTEENEKFPTDLDDHVILNEPMDEHNEIKPRAPTRFDFDTGSTNSAENWIIVNANHRDFLTKNDENMVETTDYSKQSIRSTSDTTDISRDHSRIIGNTEVVDADKISLSSFKEQNSHDITE